MRLSPRGSHDESKKMLRFIIYLALSCFDIKVSGSPVRVVSGHTISRLPSLDEHPVATPSSLDSSSSPRIDDTQEFAMVLEQMPISETMKSDLRQFQKESNGGFPHKGGIYYPYLDSISSDVAFKRIESHQGPSIHFDSDASTSEDHSTDNIELTGDRPPYWHRSHAPRTVHLAMYPLKIPWAPYPFDRLIQTWFSHWEVHIDDIAFSIFAFPGMQEIQYRPVQQSRRVFGLEMQRKIEMCQTRRSDDEIVDWLSENWRIPFHKIDSDCQVFSKTLIDFLCNGNQGGDHRDRLPVVDKVLIENYRRFFRFLRKYQNNNGPLGAIARGIGKNKLDSINGHDGWPIKEYVRQ